MGEEVKSVLLEFKGDAAGSKAAALESVAGVQANVDALQQLKAAEDAVVAAKTAEVQQARAAAQAEREQAQALEQLGRESRGGEMLPEQPEFEQINEGLDGVAKHSEDAFEKSANNTRAFKKILGSVSPELVSLINDFQSLQKVGEGAFGVSGVAAMGTLAVVVAIGTAINQIADAIRSAKKELEDAVAEYDAADEKIRERRAGAGGQLALHGVGDSVSRSAATFKAQQLTEKGISQTAADQTAAAVVAATKGGMNIDQDQMYDLAIAQQQGAIKLTRGINIADTTKNVQESLGLTERMPVVDKQALLAGGEQLARDRQEFLAAALAGNRTALEKYLQEEQNLPADKAKEMVDSFDHMRKGETLDRSWREWITMVALFDSFMRPASDTGKESDSYVRRHKEATDRLARLAQDKQDADQNVEDAYKRGENVPSDGPTVRPTASQKPVKEWSEIFQPGQSSGAPQTALPQRPSPDASSAAPTINYNFNGPNQFALRPGGRKSRTP